MCTYLPQYVCTWPANANVCKHKVCRRTARLYLGATRTPSPIHTHAHTTYNHISWALYCTLACTEIWLRRWEILWPGNLLRCLSMLECTGACTSTYYLKCIAHMTGFIFLIIHTPRTYIIARIILTFFFFFFICMYSNEVWDGIEQIYAVIMWLFHHIESCNRLC